MNADRLKWLGAGVLLLFLAALGWLIVPAHLTSIWMDREFTDWISPIANRLHGDARLYADGMHSPMPPLPYVCLRLLFPGGAIWIEENLLNYLFQCATLLLLYFIFCKRVGPGLAFAASLAAIPLFLSLGKSILYDSMAQFLTVGCAGLCAREIDYDRRSSGKAPDRKGLFMPLVTGVALGWLMLTKQSTGVGAFAGVCTVFGCLPANVGFRKRCVNVLLVIAATAATVFLISLVLSSFMNLSGMLYDVFLRGTEPKGGPRRMMNNLARYAFYNAKVILISAAVFYILSVILRRKAGWRAQKETAAECLQFSIGAKMNGARSQGRFMLLAMLVSLACMAILYGLPENNGAATAIKAVTNAQAYVMVLNLGLAACLLLGIGALAFSLGGMSTRMSEHPLAPFAIIFFSSAVFHNLSVTSFRWWSENNPLIVLALIFLLSPLIKVIDAGVSAGRKRLLMGATCIGIALMWCAFFNQIKAVQTCTEHWAEIPHLDGARLRPACEGMRELVKVVQSLASKDEAVLLLPDDPNVEAWINRKRPAVSSTILFTDQYWDRYVDRDFQALRAKPPKVIIIGPRNYWRRFSQIWHWRKEEGVIRLIDRVKDELLAKEYELRVEQRISFGPGEDFMDIYVRRSR